MKKKANARTVAKYIFLAATIVICVGLCVGSLLPDETSAATSDNFGGAVEGVLDDIGVSTGDVMDGTGFTSWQLFVRKLFGHFGAFMFLGAVASVTFMLFSKDSTRSRLAAFGMAAVFGFSFACLTELLQTDLFTTGRGASFDDVITDCRGYFITCLLFFAVWFAAIMPPTSTNATPPTKTKPDLHPIPHLNHPKRTLKPQISAIFRAER